MIKKVFALSFLALIFAAHAYAWDMGAYVENAQAGEGISDSTFVWKEEQAQPATVDSSMAFDKNKTIEHIRKGFYFSAGYTFGHVTLNDHYEDDDWDPDQTYNGWLVCYFDVRLGAHIANIISIYGTLGIGVGTGDYEHEYKGDPIEDDVTSIKGVAGVGFVLNPFRNEESPLYGLFFGLCGGVQAEGVEYNYKGATEIGIIYHTDPNIAEHDNFHNFFGRIEAGYEWWISKRWRLGTAFNYTFGGYDDGSWESITSHTFGLTIRLAH